MYILTIQCPDKPGIVATVAAALSNHNCNIEDAAQYNDHACGQFFMRVIFAPIKENAHIAFEKAFTDIAKDYEMTWHINDETTPVKTLIMVSKQDHCLHDLLYRWKTGHLNIDITGIISNHETNKPLADAHNIPFHYCPITPETKPDQENQIRQIAATTQTELIVMARYMQILSEDLCNDFQGKIINIHHSFLPGFKGAKPYHQAHERGVKIIGATAHFATTDLDEGPIIEQETTRITHAFKPKDLEILGRDIESRVLARAVKLYAERRIFLQGHRTIIL